MTERGPVYPLDRASWRLQVWLNDGTTKKASLLASAVVNDLTEATTYVEQTAASTLQANPSAYVWVEAVPGHRADRHSEWAPLTAHQHRVAVFTETNRLGTWMIMDDTEGGR